LITPILHNKRCMLAKLVDIRPGRNNEFLIWTFHDVRRKRYVGFTPTKVYFGNKTYLWYSLLVGYYLPPAYTINFKNILGKECYIYVDSKRVVRAIIPTNKGSSLVPPTIGQSNQKQTQKQESDDHDIPEEAELFGTQRLG